MLTCPTILTATRTCMRRLRPPHRCLACTLPNLPTRHVHAAAPRVSWQLRDAARALQSASVAVSPALEGTFGAATGLAGRLDPLRQTLPDLAVRRYTPHTYVTVDHLRTGPLSWHPTLAYDVTRDRTSECDVMYAQPDGLPPNARRADSLPPHALDERTLSLIRSAVDRMISGPRGPPLPFTQPPQGLPVDTSHSHAAGDEPPPPPWAPSFAQQQHDERAAAAAHGPNAMAQAYKLTLDLAEDGRAFGLER
jgi:hypothetical protein